MVKFKKICMILINIFTFSCGFFLISKNYHNHMQVQHLKISEKKTNSCILILVREKDLNQLVNKISILEKRFNQKYKYPYIIFSNENLSLTFKSTIQKYSTSLIEFGFIEKENWSINIIKKYRNY